MTEKKERKKENTACVFDLCNTDKHERVCAFQRRLSVLPSQSDECVVAEDVIRFRAASGHLLELDERLVLEECAADAGRQRRRQRDPHKQVAQTRVDLLLTLLGVHRRHDALRSGVCSAQMMMMGVYSGWMMMLMDVQWMEDGGWEKRKEKRNYYKSSIATAKQQKVSHTETPSNAFFIEL